MPTLSATNKIAEHAMRKFMAHHETFVFALQNKMEELAKYAQRKDASNFVIKKGNKELKEAADFLNAAKECMDCLREAADFEASVRTIRQRDREIKALKKEMKSWNLTQ